MPTPTIESSLPLLDSLLAAWKPQLGADERAYSNHLYRMAHFAFALSDAGEEQRQKIIIAAVFHDLGIWSDGTVDYLPPSVALARDYLRGQGLEAWSDEIEQMIDLHHKLRAVRDARSPLVEAFRRADLVDLSLGLIRFGLPRDYVAAVRRQFPNAGFHKKLGQLAGGWFAAHPLKPPPFLKW